MRARRVLLAVLVGIGVWVVFTPAASGDVTACYSVSVTVNGDAVVDEAACETVDTP